MIRYSISQARTHRRLPMQLRPAAALLKLFPTPHPTQVPMVGWHQQTAPVNRRPTRTDRDPRMQTRPAMHLRMLMVHTAQHRATQQPRSTPGLCWFSIEYCDTTKPIDKISEKNFHDQIILGYIFYYFNFCK